MIRESGNQTSADGGEKKCNHSDPPADKLPKSLRSQKVLVVIRN